MAAPAQRIQRSYVSGAGTSGGLLAAALIAFITMVGLVSLRVWPHPGDVSATRAGTDVTLSPARPAKPKPVSRSVVPTVTVSPKPVSAAGTATGSPALGHGGKVTKHGGNANQVGKLETGTPGTPGTTGTSTPSPQAGSTDTTGSSRSGTTQPA